ncbi:MULTISPECIES: flavodoxin domain-containing protein [unclassified Roseitalea]|uniref:flavodoxin domain-containing protein n=1 Tax=unclassified Roseitalea TaxID=2639107 RepID=UPI00273F2D20|nr:MULTISPECIES: flavodoxin domain-containing protein [unclassified Roseitalea]
MHIAIIYATVEGQTRTIATHIEAYLADSGHSTQVIDATHPPDAFAIDAIDGVICLGPVHIGTFPAPLRRFVRTHMRELMARPGAFISVSLTAAGGDAEEMAELAEIATAFSEETGWWPVAVHHAAGALKYTEYDYFRRWMMRRIADKHHASTDTKHDHEFTDWGELDLFIDGFLRDLPAVAGKI